MATNYVDHTRVNKSGEQIRVNHLCVNKSCQQSMFTNYVNIFCRQVLCQRIMSTCSSEQPKAVQRQPKQQPRSAQSSPSNPKQPRATHNSPEQPRTAHNSPEQPWAAPNSPEQPKAAQSNPQQPRATQSSPHANPTVRKSVGHLLNTQTRYKVKMHAFH